MGRIAAYSGKHIRWKDLMEPGKDDIYNLTMKPTAEDFEKGDVKAPQDEVCALPGKAS
jgi:hypothetical protein